MQKLLSAFRKWRLVRECRRLERDLAEQRADSEIQILRSLRSEL
jgi:hypothetical protein